MNYNNYIVLEIKDLSTGESIHSLTGYGKDGDSFYVSDKPIKYFVDSNDIKGLLDAKEIVEDLRNHIYLAPVEVESTEDPEWAYKIEMRPVYVNNLQVYNYKVLFTFNKRDRANRRSNIELCDLKKLPKHRFEVFQSFSSLSNAKSKIACIDLFEE